MKKKVVSLLMICALSVGMLAGCGSSETQNQATGSADNTQTAGTETPVSSIIKKKICSIFCCEIFDIMVYIYV